MRFILAVVTFAMFATHGAAAQTAPQSCARPAAGSIAAPPPDLYSENGVLSVAFKYVTNTDSAGRTLYCFITPDGLESPTLHVNPGDTLNITLTNQVGVPQDALAVLGLPRATKICGDKVMSVQAVNIHFHGLNVTPLCGSDEVIHTVVNPGSTFTYAVQIPADEPPGLYWYHPHVHRLSSQAVEGGATGIIVVGGIEQIQPIVSGLNQRILVLRDEMVAGQIPAARKAARNGTVAATAPVEPSWDLSLNYVPISYPQLVPAELDIVPGGQEFWRVANTAANTVTDLELKYDGAVQTVQLVALDGIPVNSQYGTTQGSTLPAKHVLIPPGGRAEFIVTAPASSISHAVLITRQIDTGPIGDIDTQRVLANIVPGASPSRAPAALPGRSAFARTVPVTRLRFSDLDQAAVTKRRTLIFSEFAPNPSEPDDAVFYITVAGKQPTVFEPNEKPAITTTQGAVEDWTIENQSSEVHEFHIHQIHFQIRAINGKPVSAAEQQIRDTFQIPYWTGTGPYPSVTLRMDFRGNIAGEFVYHCHILEHEDAGMMAIIKVLPQQ